MKAQFRRLSRQWRRIEGGQFRADRAGVIYHYYDLRDQAKTGENSGKRSALLFQRSGSGRLCEHSGGGVLASSKHQADAQAFLKWVTGHAGQAVLKDGDAYEYVVGEGEASNPNLMPLTDLDAPKVDVSKLNSKKVAELMTQAAFCDPMLHGGAQPVDEAFEPLATPCSQVAPGWQSRRLTIPWVGAAALLVSLIALVPLCFVAAATLRPVD